MVINLLIETPLEDVKALITFHFKETKKHHLNCKQKEWAGFNRLSQSTM